MTTVTGAFGRATADRLAALAIDIAAAAPETISTATTKIPEHWIAETRAALEEAGVDWRALVRARVTRDRATRRRYHEERHKTAPEGAGTDPSTERRSA